MRKNRSRRERNVKVRSGRKVEGKCAWRGSRRGGAEKREGGVNTFFKRRGNGKGGNQSGMSFGIAGGTKKK